MNHFKSKNKIFFILIILLSIILRLWHLDKYPSSLYTDEASQGYNAYSILKTGRDEHDVFLPVSLRSFGDWKPPLPTYMMIPFIAIFDLNEYSVRLPSMILGVGTIILSFFLTKKMLSNYLYVDKYALLVSFFMAISPWHILQSRSAMLVMIGLFFLMLGIYFYLKSIISYRYYLLAILFITLTIYTYYGFRLITPLFIFYIFIINRKKLFNTKKIIFAVFLIITILFPLLVNFFKNHDVIFGRAKTVSVFYNKGINLRNWELIAQDGKEIDSYLVRLFHNKFSSYTRDILKRYLSHFDLNYLFIKGDSANPFQIPGMGIMYFSDSIFFILGLIYFYKKKIHQKNIIIVWLLLSILPAALTFITPSSNRSFNAVFPFIIFISIGMMRILNKYKYKHFISILITVFYIFNMSYFMNIYYLSIPYKFPEWWGYRWKEVARYINQNKNKYENIIYLNENNMSYIYLLFYNKYDPNSYQNEVIRNYISDSAGFEHIDSFEKYIFYNDLKWQDVKNDLLPKSLYIVPIRQAEYEKDYYTTIKYPNGETALKLFSTL